jgi:gliding motility-associated-like protein
LKEVVFILFNRFGEKVFESRGQTAGWDGRIAGKMQAPGSYVYMISYKNSIGGYRSQKGSVSLIR